jgi:tetratricopeptide (TPR) repeat protein
MRKIWLGILAAALLLGGVPLRAQQPCPRLPVVINTPEDKLMLAVNGAESPQEQVDALNKFAAESPDSRFIPCVNEYLAMAHLKLQDYEKAIEAGEKDLALDYLDLNLIVNLLKAYVGAGKATDQAFELIAKAPKQIHDETSVANASTAEETDKARAAVEEQSKELRAYMEYAFFQLLPRVPEAAKRLQDLDAFVQAYPDTPNMNQVNIQYFVASQMAGDKDKMFEYGEKAVASDAENVATLNLVADGYASTQVHLKEAEEYAKKALDLATKMAKPETMEDDQFKSFRDTQMGLAHATIGFVSFQEGSARHRVAPAIGEFKAAVDLLDANPTLQARTLFYLGYAYEVLYPPNHHAAAEALTKSAGMASPWQAQATDLLEKVKKAH